MEAPAVARQLAIRPLTVGELHLCEPYGKAFHEEKKIEGAFSMDEFTKNWTLYLTKLNAILLGLWNDDKLVGGLGGMVVPDLTSGVPTATEYFLFIDEAHRGGMSWPRLVKRFREYGIAHGAKRLRMAQLLLPGDADVNVDGEVRLLADREAVAFRLAKVYWGMRLRPVEIGWDGPI